MGRLHPLADVRVAPGSVRQALADWDLDAALVRARLPAAGPLTGCLRAGLRCYSGVTIS